MKYLCVLKEEKDFAEIKFSYLNVRASKHPGTKQGPDSRGEKQEEPTDVSGSDSTRVGFNEYKAKVRSSGKWL